MLVPSGRRGGHTQTPQGSGWGRTASFPGVTEERGALKLPFPMSRGRGTQSPVRKGHGGGGGQGHSRVPRGHRKEGGRACIPVPAVMAHDSTGPAHAEGAGGCPKPEGSPNRHPPHTHLPRPWRGGVARGRPGAHSPGRWGIRPRCAPCGSRRSRRCGPGPGRAGRGRHALRPRRAGRAGSAGRGGADTAQNAEGGTWNGVPGRRGNMERIPRLKDREPETDKARRGAFPALGVEAAVVPPRKWRGESFGGVSRSLSGVL